MPAVTPVPPSSSYQSQSDLDDLDDEERSIFQNLQTIPTLGSQQRPTCRIKINISQQLIKCSYNTLVYNLILILVSIQVIYIVLRFIIGKKGETKARVEHELKTQITIPRQGQQAPIGRL